MRIKIVLFLILLGAPLAGCSRSGVGLPRAMIYENTTVPLTAKRPPRTDPSGGLPMPDAFNTTTVDAGMVNLPSMFFAPFIDTPAGIGALTFGAGYVGWGDIGTAKTLEQGAMEEVTFADLHVFSILRIYTRTRVIAHGPPLGTQPAGGGETLPGTIE